MMLLSSISNKDVLFIFSANKVAAEAVPQWVVLEQKAVKVSIDSIQAPSPTTVALKLSPVRLGLLKGTDMCPCPLPSPPPSSIYCKIRPHFSFLRKLVMWT